MKRIAIVLVIIGVALGLTARPAAALAPNALAWWWKASPLPAPPTVPAGGFMIASDPSGPAAIAAMRFALGPDQTAPFLTLEVTDDGGVGGDTAAMTAYNAASSWSPVAGGDWATKPAHYALAGVKGVRSSDGLLWTFDLSPIYEGEDVDIIINPDPGTNFALSFKPPTQATLRTSPAPVPISEFEPETETSFGDVASASVIDSGIPLDGGYVPPTDEIALNVSNPQERGSASLPGRGAPLVSPKAVDREAAALGFVLLLAAIAAGWALSRAMPPPVRALGPMTTPAAVVAAIRPGPRQAEVEVGGLGRFARARTGPPPKL